MGGANIELEVLATGAHALFKCGAVGSIEGPLLLDDRGRFEAAGAYDPKLVLGGPRTARYRSAVRAGGMTLMLEVEGERIGPYSLTEGAAGPFEVCNFQ